MAKDTKLDLVIVEAIKTIVASTDNEVKYDVSSYIETKGLKQRVVRKVTSINITIIEQV